MERNTAIEIVKSLFNLYGDKALEVNSVREAYIKILIPWSDELAATTLDVIMNTKRFCPKPAELLEELREQDKKYRENRRFAKSQEFCYICNNVGFITYKKDGYEHVLYCECDLGQAFKYDGSTNERPSEYFTEPIAKYFDGEELKARNVFLDHTPKPMPDEVKVLLRNWGRKLRV